MACANLARFSEPPSVACTKRRVRAVIRPSCIIRAMPNNKQPCVDKRQLRHRERRGGRKVVWVGVGFTAVAPTHSYFNVTAVAPIHS
mmetsp:Transcript_26037/g.82509  ORF Transcript_26037/g.82509 Transcript_26037/m.82509 type:complete len:87 (+) Transcript_26037:1144-1404(+)